MTHDELRSKIQHYNWVEANDLIQALDAVVKLHKPWPGGCSHCINIEGGYMSYPCLTIQAIEKALNG